MKLSVQSIDVPTKAELDKPIETKIRYTPNPKITSALKAPKLIVLFWWSQFKVFKFMNDIIAGKDFVGIKL